MLIANPIYDVVFKRLMENERVAKFFVGTLLNETVVRIQMRPQEFTHINKLSTLTVFRLDFAAVIQQADGTHRKVLIEIQKARNEVDLMRFRNYLGEQYKKEDTVAGEATPLPITTIYILGFKLPNIKTACIKVERQYRDLINARTLRTKNDFVERLTHDSFVVQVERITDRYQSRLDKLLSVFEQDHFVDNNRILKEYTHEADDADVREMTAILQRTGADPETRRELETELEAVRTLEAHTARQNKKLLEQERLLQQKERALDEAKEALSEKDRLIEALRKKLDRQK